MVSVVKTYLVTTDAVVFETCCFKPMLNCDIYWGLAIRCLLFMILVWEKSNFSCLFFPPPLSELYQLIQIFDFKTIYTCTDIVHYLY